MRSPAGQILQFMQPTLVSSGPLPNEDFSWVSEPKWDGIRASAYLENGKTWLRSRRGTDLRYAYPELTEAPTGKAAVLDG
jgi:ATP-dependent DNA ligase